MGQTKQAWEEVTGLTDPTSHLVGQERSGECYHLAGLFVLENPDTVLVHGSIQGYGNPRMAHAWVELASGLVWEPFTGELFANWDDFASTDEHTRYTHSELTRQIIESRHWGPWVEAPDTALPFIDEDSVKQGVEA